MTTPVHTRRRAVHDADPIGGATTLAYEKARIGSKALRTGMELSFRALAERAGIPLKDAQLLLMNGVTV